MRLVLCEYAEDAKKASYPPPVIPWGLGNRYLVTKNRNSVNLQGRCIVPSCCLSLTFHAYPPGLVYRDATVPPGGGGGHLAIIPFWGGGEMATGTLETLEPCDATPHKAPFTPFFRFNERSQPQCLSPSSVGRGQDFHECSGPASHHYQATQVQRATICWGYVGSRWV